MFDWCVTDLKSWLGSKDLSDLLLQLVGWRDDASENELALAQALHHYEIGPFSSVYGVILENRPVGLIGIDLRDGRLGVIQHIVVERDCRQSGLGKAMLRWAWDEFDAERLEAETDRESVEFYRKCGFQVQSLGSQREGIERFRCSKDRPLPGSEAV